MKKIQCLLWIVVVLSEFCMVAHAAEWRRDSVQIDGHFHSLFFVSDKVGFVLSCDPVQSSWSTNFVSRTVDGGKSWEAPVFGAASEMCPAAVFFVNNNVGYFAPRGSERGARGIRKTTNGGASWSSSDIIVEPASALEATALYFINDSVGFIGTWGAIHKTTDGGSTWLPVHEFTGRISSIAFPTAHTGYAVGDDSPIMLKTNDSGNTWSQITDQYALLSVAFPSPDKGYAVGMNGTIIYTDDAGTTWKSPSFTNDRRQTLRSVFCLDNNTCFAVGDSGTILKTDDGGNTWIRQVSETTQRLNAVACTDNNTCIAVGDNSTLLKTTDAMATGVNLSMETAAIGTYPNPSSGIVSIRLPSMINNATVGVFNLFGREIRQMRNQTGTVITIDGRDIPSGAYFFVVQQRDGTIFRGRLVIK